MGGISVFILMTILYINTYMSINIYVCACIHIYIYIYGERER